MRAAKVQASLRIRAVSPEPALLGHDGMLEDTNSLDAAHLVIKQKQNISSELPLMYLKKV